MASGDQVLRFAQDDSTVDDKLTTRVAGAPLAGAGETHGFFRRANQGARLQHALLVLGLEIRIGHDADAGLPLAAK